LEAEEEEEEEEEQQQQNHHYSMRSTPCSRLKMTRFLVNGANGTNGVLDVKSLA
jgi:hypothetical protein